MPGQDPFSTAAWFDGSPLRRAIAWIHPLVDRALGLSTLGGLHRALVDDGRPFADRALEALHVGCEIDASRLDRVPPAGPLVIVANHPLGGLDGLVVAHAMQRVRPDVKLLANGILTRIPDLDGLLVPVDPFGGTGAVARNSSAFRAALRWLRAGGAIVAFPAGEVAHTDGREDGADSPWSAGVGRLILRGEAGALPLFIGGATGAVFRWAGRIHPYLRTALLPRELLRQRDRRVAIRIGLPIPHPRLADLGDAERITGYLRLRTYALADRPSGPDTRTGPRARAAPIAASQPAEAIARDIEALPSEKVLLRHGDSAVCIGTAAELPHALPEIGRLREIAFRAVGEGTGRERDLDAFDGRYDHLFVWNAARGEIVGAYRVGRTDRILATAGVQGLYTSTLFRYDRRLLGEITPALELGRAFVRTEYQRDYSPLLLLWRGVGALVAAEPRYRMLFGPVSISSAYHSLSQQILAAFLYANNYRADLAALVSPRRPPPFAAGYRRPARLGAVVRKLAEVASLLAEIESDGKSIPVLLRQYLKLDAKLLGFNVDPTFGDALDGLMLVDLLDVDRDILTRYMGRDGAAAFLRHHGQTPASQRAS